MPLSFVNCLKRRIAGDLQNTKMSPEKVCPGRVQIAETVPGHLKISYSFLIGFSSMNFDEPAFAAALSGPRIGRYLQWANGDLSQAIELYRLNCRMSESLYLPLHVLEIVLRNRIHDIATQLPIGDVSLVWFDRPEFLLRPRQPEQIAKARRELRKDRKPDAAVRVVAALTFGFWTTLLGPEYETLWQRGLNRIARTKNGKGLQRKMLSEPLLKIRFLRNRIAHHEPIIHWNLGHHHDKILKLIGYLSPIAAQWANQHSRFREVYPTERIRLHAEV